MTIEALTTPELGAAAIRKVLVTKIGLDKQDSFNLDHQNGKDVVFVQSDTTTPLVGCLKDVKSALGCDISTGSGTG